MGFKGPDCEKATEFLEEALGVVGKKVKKPEYHQHGTRTNQQKLGAGNIALPSSSACRPTNPCWQTSNLASPRIGP